MTSTTIGVHVKKSDEIINVSVSLAMTMKDIIQYVSENSLLSEKIDCTDYYLVLLSNEKLLKNDMTVEETEALTMQSPQFELREKVEIREQIIILASRNSYKNVSENKLKPQMSVEIIQHEEEIASNDDEEKSLSSNSKDDVSIVELSDHPVTESSTEIETTLSTSSIPSIVQFETCVDTNILQNNSSITDENLPVLDRSESILTERNSITNTSDTLSSLSSLMQPMNEGLTSFETNLSLSNDNKNSSRSNALAGTYLIVKNTIEKVIVAATRDPVMRRDISAKFNEINIVLCGSPRVGKSTLINAICQRTLAKTSPGLDSCTHGVSRYILRGSSEKDSELINYQYNFWDTPGFERWTQEEIRKNLERIFKKPKSDILCMIYCASPGSYANLEQLRWLLDECMNKQIFCALVCTNKWGGQKKQREGIMQDFQRLLANYHPKTREDNGVTYFGKKGLCIAVNSERYVDDDIEKIFEQSGIDELILGIMESLDNEKLLEWCKVVLENKPFWKNLFNFPEQLESLWNRLLGKT